jgi:hypothetical protein
MKYPLFYDKVEPFILKDELSNFLGATDNGIIKINYLDCVKLASHSCPTVAGSYIITKVALNELFKDEMPLRGAIRVELKEPKESGVIGVIGAVAGYICGASDNGGFVGIGGKFNKRDLLTFNNSDVNGLIRFRRVDNNKSVTLNLDTSKVPANPKMKELMQKSLQGLATKEEELEFKELWQSRVEYMLLNTDKWNLIAQIINKES